MYNTQPSSDCRTEICALWIKLALILDVVGLCPANRGKKSEQTCRVRPSSLHLSVIWLFPEKAGHTSEKTVTVGGTDSPAQCQGSH